MKLRKRKIGRRLGSLLLSVCLVLTMTVGAVPALSEPVWADVAYTDIGTAEQLATMRNDLDGKYRLTANITLSDDWTPIGTRDVPFTGELDGNGYTITGLYVLESSSLAYAGLFGVIGWDGKVKNLSVDIAAGGVNGAGFVGGIAGYNEGTLENCRVSGGSVKGINNAPDDNLYAGGVAGENRGDLLQCVNSSAVDARGSDSYSQGTSVGGVAGANFGYLFGCLNTGSVSGEGGVSRSGGVAGYNGSYSGIYESANSGTVSAITTAASNGLAFAGGVTGINLHMTEVLDCFSTGNVSGGVSPTGAGIVQAGGVVGVNDGKVSGSYGAGTVTGTTPGGIVGRNYSSNPLQEGLVAASFFDSEIAGTQDVAGDLGTGTVDESSSGKTTAEMKTKTTFTDAGWDFDGVWEIDGTYNQGYPYLPAVRALAEGYILIGDAEGLAAIGRDLSQKYWLTDDIDLTGAWAPIGDDTPFTGELDGNNHTISGLSIPASAGRSNVGLFGAIGDGGKVKDLSVIIAAGGVNAAGADAKFAGGIAGKNSGTIENCSVSGGPVKAVFDSNVVFSGGIAGENKSGGKITKSANTSAVYALAGQSDTGATVYAGGLVGANAGEVIESANSGEVQAGAAYGSRVGGVAGVNNGTVAKGANAGAVKAAGADPVYAGGVTGENGGALSESFNLGSVNAVSSQAQGIAAGGVAGLNGDSLSNCFSTGAVSASGSGSSAGGVVGKDNGSAITNTYAAGTVTGEVSGGVAGIVTPAATSITASFFDKEVAGNLPLIGEPITETITSSAGITGQQMRTKATFTDAGWNFADDDTGIWQQAEGMYPTLRHAVLPPSLPAKPDTPSGGKGGGSSQPEIPPAVISGATATTEVKAAVSADGKASASVTAAQMTETIAKAGEAAAKTGEEPRVEIKIEAPKDAATVEVAVPQAAMASMAGGKLAGVTLSSPVASMTFDSQALNTIAGGASGDVKFTAARISAEDLPTAVQALLKDRPVYEFSVTAGGKNISSFGGKVTLEVPYKLGAGENPNAIIVSFINASGNLEVVTNGRYDEKTGTVIFTTDHFSKYAIGYNKVDFSDVRDSAWYADAVTFLAAREITGGTTENTFSPSANLTRGQFITMVLKAYGIAPESSGAANFSDAGNTYYTGYLAAAKGLGITEGVGDNKFAPTRQITRQEMFTLLYNALEITGQLPAKAAKEGESKSDKTLDSFTDSDRVAGYAQEGMKYLIEAGLVKGSDGKLTPTATTTRAEMAQVLYRLLNR